MDKIGYIKSSNESSSIKLSVNRLVDDGIPLSQIVISDDFQEALDKTKPGDQIVVCSFTEICRGMLNLFELLSGTLETGVVLRSLDDPWLDMTSETCRWNDCVMGFARLGKKILSDSTRNGLSNAKAKGKALGRPKGSTLQPLKNLEAGLRLYRETSKPIREICNTTGIHPRTLYRYIQSNEIPTRRKKRVEVE